MRKLLCSILTLFMVLTVIPVTAFADGQVTLYSGELNGFSYYIGDDECFVDSEKDYCISLNITQFGGVKQISISNGPDELEDYDFTNLIANEMSDESLVADFDNGNGSIYIEFCNENPLVDICIGNYVYAFGGVNRIEKVEAYLTSNYQVVASENGYVYEENAAMASAGRVKLKSNDKIRLEASWKPANQNELDLLINTVGSRTLEKVTKIQISNGAVPSSYVIAGANPSGASGSTSNFVSFFNFLINATTPIKVWLPAVSSGTTSSYSGYQFSFNVSMNVDWNSMNYTYSSSTGKTNGMVLYLFLNHNGVTPTPTGTVKLTTHIPATGTFYYTLAF
ncbi:MAG: hypothetical protein ACI3VE_02895 [Oscillospiraceae bacterium]